MKIKKVVAISLALVMLTTFTGCHEHTFVAKTCTEPATCTICGETYGEPLGHDWVDADCENPKYCLLCNEQEGEPLGHDVSIGTCSVCGNLVNVDAFTKDIYHPYFVAELYSYDQAMLDGEISKASSKSDYDFRFEEFEDKGAYIFEMSIRCLNNALPYYEELASNCSDYSELSEIKELVEKMIECIPAEYTNYDVYCDKIIRFSQYDIELRIKMEKLEEEYGILSGDTDLDTDSEENNLDFI